MHGGVTRVTTPLPATTTDDPRAGSTTGDRIVRSALAAFADRGVDATSLDAVADDVGVRKQTLLYWFPSKEALLVAVIDHAVGELSDRLALAVREAEVTDRDAVVAVVDATFRLGSTDPALLALVREVARVGGLPLTHLGTALEPLLDRSTAALAVTSSRDAVSLRAVLVDVGARVVGMATEAELRNRLGQPADAGWLRARRRALLADLRDRLG